MGQSFDLIRRNALSNPAGSPAPAAAPRPQVSLGSTESRSGNVRLAKQMPTELTLMQEFMYQLHVQANENVGDVVPVLNTQNSNPAGFQSAYSHYLPLDVVNR